MFDETLVKNDEFFESFSVEITVGFLYSWRFDDLQADPCYRSSILCWNFTNNFLATNYHLLNFTDCVKGTSGLTDF